MQARTAYETGNSMSPDTAPEAQQGCGNCLGIMTLPLGFKAAQFSALTRRSCETCCILRRSPGLMTFAVFGSAGHSSATRLLMVEKSSQLVCKAHITAPCESSGFPGRSHRANTDI